jgi:glycosyltransferase involved in cell wall biosynthesis
LPVIGVVIPAFNAEQTIDRTLASVQAQTHVDLEIIVVDDGSGDRTAERVLRRAREDHRIRLVHQENGGVASARNRGIAESGSQYIAPLDADDLWHPSKLSRQLAVLDASAQSGMVVTAYSVIDPDDRVVAKVAGTSPKTHQFEDLCRRNFIGNGSSALMRRGLLDRSGGYDQTLRQRGGQGCEDLKLYLQIAEVTRLALIREPLTAYRRGPANMSGDVWQMVRSFDLVADDFCQRRPELRDCFSEHRVNMICWLLNGSIRAGKLQQAGELARQLVATRSDAMPAAVLNAIGRTVRGATRRWLIERGKRPPLAWQ